MSSEQASAQQSRNLEHSKDSSAAFSNENPEAEKFKRGLFLALTLFTVLIAIINVLQYALLGVVDNKAWIIAVPAVVSAGFLLFLSLYCLRGKNREHSRKALSGHWSRKVARLGVILTIFLNIILCEFVYLNAVVVKDYDKIIWNTQIDAVNDISTPSIAVIQGRSPQKAILENSTEALDALCAKKLRAVPVNQRCFNNWKTYTNKAYGLVHYVTFNGSAYQSLDMRKDVDVAFYFSYNGPNTPSLGYTVFDSNLLPDFEAALDCGIIRSSTFAPLMRNELNIEQFVINDDVSAMHRTDSDCRKFTHYKAYRTVMTSTGVGVPNGRECRLNSDTYKGPCTGDIDVRFSSLLSTSHTSMRKTNWLKFFTDEGAIIGGTCFITWFLMIFAQ